MRTLFLALSLAIPTTQLLASERVTVPCDRDGTLIEHTEGRLANGWGANVFVGRTAQPKGSARRAMLHFDLSSLPKHAIVESATLTLHVGISRSTPNQTTLHRVLSDWGEGLSVSMGGRGAPAAPGDATWLHRFFEPTPAVALSKSSTEEKKPGQPATWHHPGGDYVTAPVATTVVAGTGVQTWHGKQLAMDVQRWLRQPKNNFGWILIGEEHGEPNVKSIASRQHVELSKQPKLEIVYRIP